LTHDKANDTTAIVNREVDLPFFAIAFELKLGVPHSLRFSAKGARGLIVP
jgi:hypothetical protein